MAGGVGGQSVAGARLDVVCVSSCLIVLVCVSVYPVRTASVFSATPVVAKIYAEYAFMSVAVSK